MKDSFGTGKDQKKKLIWAVLFIVIAALSVFAVTKATKGFSFATLKKLLDGAHPLYVCCAVAAMFGFIIFEGLAIKCLVRSFGHSCSFHDCIEFSAADIYFSAITPSATGGQPASAYMMIQRGIPSSCTTVSLVFNLSLYTLAIIIIGSITLVTVPEVYFFFRPAARVLIIIGAITLALLVVLSVLVAVKRSFINTIGRIAIATGCRFRVLRDRKKWNDRLEKWTAEYMEYASQIASHKSAVIKALIFNVLQRTCQLSVTMFMYIAVNINSGALSKAEVFSNGAHLLGAQSLISIGSTYIPIPGAMGFTDLMMVDGFSTLMPEADAAGLELLSRFVSFYSCVIICFVITMVAIFIRGRKNEES